MTFDETLLRNCETIYSVLCLVVLNKQEDFYLYVEHLKYHDFKHVFLNRLEIFLYSNSRYGV